MAKQALLGNKLRRVRRAQRLTQVEMAGQLGISPSYLNLIEHNQRSLTLPLLFRLAELYGVDIKDFSGTEEARLLAELTELFADPLLREHEIGPDALGELVGASPEIARAVLALYRGYRNAYEDVLGLTERLARDPYLALAFHRLLTVLTSVRSYAEILQDHADLGSERRQNFVDILVQDSETLTGLVKELVDFFADHGLRVPRGTRAPADEVADLLHAQANHFPDLEALAEDTREALALRPANAFDVLVDRLAGEHGVSVEIGRGATAAAALRQYDARTGRFWLSEALPPATTNFQLARRLGALAGAPRIAALVDAAALSDDAARELYAETLASYFAGALLMPYRPFLEAARELRHDIELLQGRFGVSYEQVCHRLTTLQRPGAEGVPFHFLRVDPAGNILKRLSRSGLSIPRYGSACPLWNVHSAFMTPGRIDTDLVRLPDGTTYIFVARSLTKSAAGHARPRAHYSIAIGCDASFAPQLVYADGLDCERLEAATPVGITCRQCEREDCLQRAYPPLLRAARTPAADAGDAGA